MCATDSLLFTCTAIEILTLRVTLPSGIRLFFDSSGMPPGNVPDGFSVESRSVIPNVGITSYNYTLSLSIDNASLLNGDMILCDDTTSANQDTAGCPVVGKFSLPVASYCVSGWMGWLGMRRTRLLAGQFRVWGDLDPPPPNK